MGFIRALIVLHRTYASRGARDRLHTFVRFLTCPFLRVVRHVPRGASLLEIGAGHGVFATLARTAAGGRVVAVDPDVRKLRAIDGVQVVAGYDDCVRGTFDAVAIIDVLYKMPLDEWDALLARIAARLKPGGLLIVKEQDPTARLKNAWNRIQERLATALGLTLGESFSYEAPRDFVARLQRHGFDPQPPQRIDFGYPHPHILYLAYHQGTGHRGQGTGGDVATTPPVPRPLSPVT
ncbi:MAG TPA: methyltransferase domain-containing protein [Thermoanaerobaculia bacterium]|nr:methyltransferase domain-containing protein [Thermoanaerobaculia bacterium]